MEKLTKTQLKAIVDRSFTPRSRERDFTFPEVEVRMYPALGLRPVQVSTDRFYGEAHHWYAEAVEAENPMLGYCRRA